MYKIEEERMNIGALVYVVQFELQQMHLKW